MSHFFTRSEAVTAGAVVLFGMMALLLEMIILAAATTYAVRCLWLLSSIPSATS